MWRTSKGFCRKLHFAKSTGAATRHRFWKKMRRGPATPDAWRIQEIFSISTPKPLYTV
jgi:hypothetical protein